MSEFEATGEELEKLVKLGRNRPMPFAFCPPKGEDDPVFATHRTKKPEVIAKSARKSSGQTQVAFGYFTVEEKVMVLVLHKELPLIAKRLKKHLRRERLSLDIRVLDIDGNELEAELEEQPQAPAAMQEQVAPEPEPAVEEPRAETTPEEAAVQSLSEELTHLRRIAESSAGPTREKLSRAVDLVDGLIQAGDLERAVSTLPRLANLAAQAQDTDKEAGLGRGQGLGQSLGLGES